MLTLRGSSEFLPSVRLTFQRDIDPTVTPPQEGTTLFPGPAEVFFFHH